MTVTLLESPVVADRAHALRLAKQVIKTLDQKPLKPIVAAMLTEGHKAALSAMAVSRDEPNLFEQFLVLCEEAGLLSGEDCDQLGDAYVEARRARAA
jgi:hypothetical protein